MSERRQMGALAVIGRKNKAGNYEVFLFNDERKPEMVAGIPVIVGKKGEKALSFPGGGRDFIQQEQCEETIDKTIRRELQEELISDAFAQTPLTFYQQEWPIAVAQEKEKSNESEGLDFNLIAMTTVWINFDDLSVAQQQKIEYLIDYETAFWVNLNELASEYQRLVVLSGNPESYIELLAKLLIRPQVLAAAEYWAGRWEREVLNHQERDEKNAKAALAEDETNARNRLLFNTVKTLAGKDGVINNGAFDAQTGNPLRPEELPREDSKYLYAYT